MAYPSEIIRALEELIANQGGDLFQSIATLHATKNGLSSSLASANGTEASMHTQMERRNQAA